MTKFINMLMILLLATIASADSKAEKIREQVVKAEKRKIAKNRGIKLNSLKLSYEKKLNDRWTGYVFDVEIIVSGKKQPQKVNDIVFSDGGAFVNKLYDLKTGKDYAEQMYPTLTKDYYKDEYLIAGNKNAKHKMVVFSDPLCPICIQFLPKVINKIKQAPEEIALYYIHFPLDMHPTAKLIAKATIVAEKKGIENIAYKVYNGRFEDYYDAYKEKNDKVAIDAFNSILGTSITLKEVNTKKIKKELQAHYNLSLKAMVKGTPTVYFDGEKDSTRSKYLKYLK